MFNNIDNIRFNDIGKTRFLPWQKSVFTGQVITIGRKNLWNTDSCHTHLIVFIV